MTDKTKICSQCTINEEHNGHKIKKIKTLKAEGAKVKGELQQSLLNIIEYEGAKGKDCEQTKKVFIHTIAEQFKAIKVILVEKEFELVQQANSLFNADKLNVFEESFALKHQIDETIKDITYACQDEKGDMMILDNETSNYQSIVEKQSQFLKDKSSRVHNNLLDIQKDFKAIFENCNKAINSFSLVNQKVVKEIYSVPGEQQQPSQEELTKKQKKLKRIKLASCLKFNKKSECLEISVKRTEPMPIEIDQDDFKDIKTITITIECFITMMKEMTQFTPSLLPYILHGLESLHTLNVSFLKEDINEIAFVWLGNVFHNHLHHLRKFSFSSESSKISHQSLQVLCDNVLSKTINLQSFLINLEGCGSGDRVTETLVRCLQPFHKKLEDLSIFLGCYVLKDHGIIEIFQLMQNMSALQSLSLQFILIEEPSSDKSIELFGEKVLPNLKALKSLSLRILSCTISEKGVWSILKNLPNLKNFEYDIPKPTLSDQMMKTFSEEILPKLDSLETLTFRSSDLEIKKCKDSRAYAIQSATERSSKRSLS